MQLSAPKEPNVTEDCPTCRSLAKRIDELETHLCRIQGVLALAQRYGETDDPLEQQRLEAEIHLLRSERDT